MDVLTKPAPAAIFKPEELARMQAATPARIGIGHAGARCTTKTVLAFRAAQARANAAVFSEVSPETVAALGVFEVSTKCRDKYEMLTRPDWGRILPPEAQETIRQNCRKEPQVQIYFGDGLCAPAIGENLPDLYPALRCGLEGEGITVGTPFFVRHCRVNTARTVGPLVGAEVTCVLIGERPGLITASSMSAYIAYHAGPDMSESDYTVVSNISPVGLVPVEAAAYITGLITEILRQKKSGVALDSAAVNGGI